MVAAPVETLPHQAGAATHMLETDGTSSRKIAEREK
jgi:hypothetical protein